MANDHFNLHLSGEICVIFNLWSAVMLNIMKVKKAMSTNTAFIGNVILYIFS